LTLPPNSQFPPTQCGMPLSEYILVIVCASSLKVQNILQKLEVQIP